MKTTIKMLMLFCFVGVYSQNVKVKKDKVFIEKQEVCKLVTINRNHYEIQDLSGKPIFNFQVEIEIVTTLDGEEQFEFLKFKKPNDDEVYYSDYDLSDLKISFSTERTLIRHLIKKNEFLSNSSINYDKINSFFSQPQPRSKEMEQKQELFQEAYKYVEDFNLRFNGNEILKVVEEKDTLVGTYKIRHDKSGFTAIHIYDAKAFLTATHKAGTISLFDGNRIKFKIFSRDENENAHKIVERMIIAGYTLGDMQAVKADIIIKKHKEDVKAEKQTSVNIYEQEATVYDAEGNTIKGELTLEFYELESQKSGISSLNNYGGVATLKTIEENGKYKYTDYKAKDGIKICLETSGKCFQGIRTIGITPPKFNEEVDVTGKLKLYKSKSFNYYVIKKEDTEKGLIVSASTLFKSNNSEKMLQDMFEYLSDCPSLKDKLVASEIDLKSEAEIKQIVTTYNTCK